MKVLKDLNKLLDDYLLQGKNPLKRFNISLATIRELEDIRQELETVGKAETINNTIYELCMYCGLKTKIKGIGWQIMKQPAIGKI